MAAIRKLTNKLKLSDAYKREYYQRNGYGVGDTIVYALPTAQFKFWQWNQHDTTGDIPERGFNETVEDCPCYQEEYEMLECSDGEDCEGGEKCSSRTSELDLKD